jgi:hypothetical protein
MTPIVGGGDGSSVAVAIAPPVPNLGYVRSVPLSALHDPADSVATGLPSRLAMEAASAGAVTDSVAAAADPSPLVMSMTTTAASHALVSVDPFHAAVQL